MCQTSSEKCELSEQRAYQDRREIREAGRLWGKDWEQIRYLCVFVVGVDERGRLSSSVVILVKE